MLLVPGVPDTLLLLLLCGGLLAADCCSHSCRKPSWREARSDLLCCSTCSSVLLPGPSPAALLLLLRLVWLPELLLLMPLLVVLEGLLLRLLVVGLLPVNAAASLTLAAASSIKSIAESGSLLSGTYLHRDEEQAVQGHCECITNRHIHAVNTAASLVAQVVRMLQWLWKPLSIAQHTASSHGATHGKELTRLCCAARREVQLV